jgi:hypothetical protein
MLARAGARVFEAGAQLVQAPEGERRRRAVQPGGRLELAVRHAREQRV